MTTQAGKVLAYFQKWGSDSYHNISLVTKIPRESVRRSIQELIHEGHRISFAGTTGVYTYIPTTGDSHEQA